MRSIEIPQIEDRDWRYRAFEILPGVLTWIILSFPITLGLISPKLTAYFIVTYLILWFVRLIGLNIRVVQGWKLMNAYQKVNWKALIRDLETPDVAPKQLINWHSRNLTRVGKYIPAKQRIKPNEVYHAVFIAFWNEARNVVEPTVESVVNSNYDLKKMILILAYEQRGGPEVEKTAKDLIKKYGHYFHKAEAVMHPWPMTGEVIGKGGNITYAARWFKNYLEEEKINPRNVLVTTLDSDNRPHKEYFSALTYTYCSTEEPKNASYQPVTLYTNNIWDAPAPMRVIATGNSFWNIVLSLRQHLLRNFSAHSQSMEALIDTDFWSVRTIVEDGHQFWRSWFRFDGNHEVFPIFVPIYQDAVFTDKYTKTLKMQFVQIRRWAWGASDIAYVANQGFFKKNNIPRYKVWAKFLRLLETHIGWSTAGPLLLFGAFVISVVNPNSYIALQLPPLAVTMQRIASIGILITLFISLKSLPPKPERYKKRRTFWMIIQWVYLPATTLVYSSFAAIYAQTRLMFGWYLGFVVTEKAVKK